jgi:hypothetical protein
LGKMIAVNRIAGPQMVRWRTGMNSMSMFTEMAPMREMRDREVRRNLRMKYADLRGASIFPGIRNTGEFEWLSE